MKSRELNADDFEVGLHFTVIADEDEGDRSTEQGGIFPFALIGMNMPYGSQFRGHVLEIRAINLPYLACECLSSEGALGKVFEIDTSRVRLMRLNEEYVAARRVRKPRPWWKFWGNGS